MSFSLYLRLNLPWKEPALTVTTVVIIGYYKISVSEDYVLILFLRIFSWIW
jgi:hypothetical protein